MGHLQQVLRLPHETRIASGGTTAVMTARPKLIKQRLQLAAESRHASGHLLVADAAEASSAAPPLGARWDEKHARAPAALCTLQQMRDAPEAGGDLNVARPACQAGPDEFADGARLAIVACHTAQVS